MKYIFDRFEGDFAVCETYDNSENIKMVNIEKIKVPKGCQSGDVIFLDKQGRYQVDKDETEKLKQQALELYKKVQNKSKK